jgi:hypothetical protein
MQQVIKESGLLFDPPEGYFRIQDAPYFKDKFQRYGLCEMDFGWLDADQHILHLLELKDYSTRELPPDLTGDLVQKATDSLLLLSSIYYGLPHQDGIRGVFPAECHEKPAPPARIQITFVIKTPSRDTAVLLQKMRDSLKNRIAGRLELLDLRLVTDVFLVDQWIAKDLLKLPIDFEEETDRKRRKNR